MHDLPSDSRTGPHAATALLRVSALSKAFGGRPVVEDLSLTVAPGEVVALVGPNGAGKTTVLRCIVGTDVPDSGEVLLDGAPLDDTSVRTRRRVCSLLDDTAYLPDLTAQEHLELFARAHGVADADERVSAALRELRIDHVADQLPGTLSSGQAQRLALAQALVRPWDLLVIDEPEQRLDDTGRAWLGAWLAAQATLGRAVLMASHDPAVRDGSGARVVPIAEHD